MRPDPHREHAHEADLQQNDAAGATAEGQIEGKRRAMVEIDRNGQGGLRCCWAVIAARRGSACMARGPVISASSSRRQRLCVPPTGSPSSLVKGTNGTILPP